MKLEKPPIEATIAQTVSFDEDAGVLAIGWTASPGVNLGSTLACRVTAEEARALARALNSYADRAKP
jgi:hypothetical protein